MLNSNLSKAKTEKNDEFYTQYEDIEKEVNCYFEYDKDVFKNKTILCPCDDPIESKFCLFFITNFKRFGIKKLITTSYARNSKRIKSDLFSFDFEKQSKQYNKEINNDKGKVYVLEEDITKDGKVDINDIQWKYLEGDGDFRSEEVKKFRNEADIIITNPPFSLFREFVDWIMEADKKFLIVGNMNAITYKNIFKYIANNKIWLGNCFRIPTFIVPNENTTSKTYKVDNKLIVKMGNCNWFTNIQHKQRHKSLQLMTAEENLKYHSKDLPNGYVKYDNYDAIEVPKVSLIPKDYTEEKILNEEELELLNKQGIEYQILEIIEE